MKLYSKLNAQASRESHNQSKKRNLVVKKEWVKRLKEAKKTNLSEVYIRLIEKAIVDISKIIKQKNK